MYRRYLDWSSELSYLGIVFKCGVEMSINVASCISKFMGTTCLVLRDRTVRFENICFSCTNKVFAYLLYGNCSLHLTSISLSSLSVIWNTAFRWIFGYGKYELMRRVLLKYGSMSFIFFV